MDTMPAGRSPIRFPTFEEARQTIRDKLISRLGPIVPKPALTPPIPVSTVHARLGPRPSPESLVPFEFRHEERSSDGIEQAASSTTSLKRPRGPENRPARNKAFFKAKVEELTHIPEKRRVPFRHPYQWVPRPDSDSEHSDEFDEPNPYERDFKTCHPVMLDCPERINHRHDSICLGLATYPIQLKTMVRSSFTS